MKTRLVFPFAALLVLLGQVSTGFAQTTTFTCQGRLTENGTPAQGIYDLRFTIYDAASVGSAVTAMLDRNDAAVTNGLFTATLDFTAAPFDGSDRWLQIAVRPGASAGAYTNLDPRQKITATPYAITAGNLNGALSSTSLSGTYANAVTLNNGANSFSGNGANLSALNASQLTSGDVPAAALNNAWKPTGNAGTMPGADFIGTTDDQPLELKVYNQRGLRLEPAGGNPNVIGGYSGNVVNIGFSGATISGGGSSGVENRIGADFATVGGGKGNTSGGDNATVGGGERNTSGGPSATVGGGYQNISIGVGATVPGGYFNSAGGAYSFAAGHYAKANHDGAFVWADSQNADFTSTAADQFLIRAAGGVGIGTGAPGQLLQVGDVNTPNSQGMMRFGSRSGSGPASRYWDIGVPEGENDVGGKFYSFVIDDPQTPPGPEFLIRWDTGFVGIATNNPTERLHVHGNIYATGAITPNSDRNMKTDFAPVDPTAILADVVRLPIQQWRFKAEAGDIKHVGPMAQDFRAAFGLGAIPTAIATVDADGVALAAIQGLNQKVEETRAENAELKRELSEIKRLLLKLSDKKD